MSMRFFWVLTLLSCLAAGLIMLLTMASGGSAPQEAAGYAMACAFAVVPYVFTRAAEAIAGLTSRESVAKIVTAIESLKDKTP